MNEVRTIQPGEAPMPDPYFADPEFESPRFVEGYELCQALARALKLGRGVERVALDVPVGGVPRATVIFAMNERDVERVMRAVEAFEIDARPIS